MTYSDNGDYSSSGLPSDVNPRNGGYDNFVCPTDISRPVPLLSVTSPSGSEVFSPGQTMRISWTERYLKSLQLNLNVFNSSAASSSSIRIATVWPFGVTTDKPDTSSGGTYISGSYNWTVPVLSKLPGGGVNTDFRVRISGISSSGSFVKEVFSPAFKIK